MTARCESCGKEAQCGVWGRAICYRCLSRCIDDGCSGSRPMVDSWIADSARRRVQNDRRTTKQIPITEEATP